MSIVIFLEKLSISSYDAVDNMVNFLIKKLVIEIKI